jgi:hypothetical protein
MKFNNLLNFILSEKIEYVEAKLKKHKNRTNCWIGIKIKIVLIVIIDILAECSASRSIHLDLAIKKKNYFTALN